MDSQFLSIQESRPEEFAGVDSYKLFGTKVDAGFKYDSMGRDLTYTNENVIEFDPLED
jgi:hypothetical protein